jgi:5-methylcytosine-specific restriction protein A
MPQLPLRPCPHSGCPVIGPCPTHKRQAKPVPEIRLYDDRRGSSTARGYGYKWQQFRKEYIKRHPSCCKCGKPTTDVDHVTPRANGGSDDERNLQPLCSFHHKQKTARERGMR